MKVYIVTMYRYGHKQGHSYILGSFGSLDVALAAAQGEEAQRGGKYAAEVLEMVVNTLASDIVRAVQIQEVDNPYKDKTNAICEQCGQIIEEVEQ